MGVFENFRPFFGLFRWCCQSVVYDEAFGVPLDLNLMFGAELGLAPPSQVVSVEFDAQGGRLYLGWGSLWLG